jgi:hypothetical protein
MEDDDDSTTAPKRYDDGAVAVVEAFDNPWNEGAFVDHAGSVIFMASGLNDCGAKEAAKMLISKTNELDRFWRAKPIMCGDVNCDGRSPIDVSLLRQRVYHGQNVSCEWGGDVNCDGLTPIDVPLLRQIIFHGEPEGCCKGCE